VYKVDGTNMLLEFPTYSHLKTSDWSCISQMPFSDDSWWEYECQLPWYIL